MILGRSVDDDVGLKEAPFSEEDFAPGKIRFRNGFLDGEAYVAGSKFFYCHPNGFGRYSGRNRFLLFENGPVPSQP